MKTFFDSSVLVPLLNKSHFDLFADGIIVEAL